MPQWFLKENQKKIIIPYLHKKHNYMNKLGDSKWNLSSWKKFPESVEAKLKKIETINPRLAFVNNVHW